MIQYARSCHGCGREKKADGRPDVRTVGDIYIQTTDANPVLHETATEDSANNANAISDSNTTSKAGGQGGEKEKKEKSKKEDRGGQNESVQAGGWRMYY